MVRVEIRLCRTTLSAMHVFAMLKWTATILLVYISECRGRSVDQENTSCVYSFHVPSSQVQAGCPGNGQSSEVFRLTESLTQVHHVLEKLQCAFEVLQVIMRAYSLVRPTLILPYLLNFTLVGVVSSDVSRSSCTTSFPPC